MNKRNAAALCRIISDAPFGYVPEWYFSGEDWAGLQPYVKFTGEAELKAIAPDVARFMTNGAYMLSEQGRAVAGRSRTKK